MSITNKINFDNLRGDMFGGLTAAIVSLPLALAFGVASGAGPIAGLYGANWSNDRSHDYYCGEFGCQKS
jgi:SulP family sulfate permease